MKTSSLFFVVALVAFVHTNAQATGTPEPLRIVNPLTLDARLQKSLSASDKEKIASAFERFQTATEHGQQAAFTRNLAIRPLVTAPTTPLTAQTVRDPVTGAHVNVDAYVAESVLVQKAFYANTGRNLKANEPLDLNALSHTPPAGTGTATAPAPPPKMPMVHLVGPPGDSCPAPPNPNDLRNAWQVIKTFHAHPSDDQICSLPFGGLIKQVAASQGQPILPDVSSLAFSRQFGDSKTAQGTFSFAPMLNTADSKNVFDASMDLTFKVSFLNGQIPAITVLDGTAKVVVPRAGRVTSMVSIGGAAFPDNSSFKSYQSIDGSFSYSGQPSKNFTFYSFSHSYPVPWLLGSTSVDVTASVSGATSLDYDVYGGADGLYARAIPNVKANATATAKASALRITGVGITGDVTVQNSKSSFTGLATLVSYKGATYSVERIQAVYAPSSYQATIIVTGYFPLLLKHWKATVMDTGLRPVTLGSFTDDSNWNVQLIKSASTPTTP